MNPPGQSITEALHTTTYIHIYKCHRHENRFGNEMTTFHTFSING